MRNSLFDWSELSAFYTEYNGCLNLNIDRNWLH
uniref:Uncharacterized protein n=1 Tax=Caenorhabditis japonica TaxID=281687 RepID=A0A8R1E856_CAEJA